MHLLVRRVGRAKVRTNGDHIHIWHDTLDDTTLQTCVDDSDLGGLARDLFVSTAHRLEDGGVSIGRPAVVSTSKLNLSTRQIHRALDLRSDVLLAALRGATQHEGSGEGAVADEDLRHIRRGLYDAREVSEHALHAIDACIEGPDDAVLDLFGDDRLGQIRALEAEADAVLDILILRLQGVEEVRSELPQAVSLCFGDGHEREGFARDRIAS